MKRLLFLLFIAVMNSSLLMAQGENNIWNFAVGTTSNPVFVNFNSGSPSLVNGSGYSLANSIAVCRPNGQLCFLVRLTGNLPSGFQAPNVINANGDTIPNSNLLTGNLAEFCMPIVVPKPGNADQYYIFYSCNAGLCYTLLDMSMNGGNGGIVSNQKNIMVSPYGTIVAQKMTAVKGCNGVWIVTRCRTANEYLSFRISNSGVDTSAVVSSIGNFSQYDYNFNEWGFLKASPDGDKLAICGWAGVELYDFEKCSGMVKNARVLETTGNPPINAYLIFNHYRFNGLCFSPDGSKLYVTKNHRSETLPQGISNGELYQYDLNQGTLPAIIASRTLILTNQPSIMEQGPFCNLVAPNPLGEIKNGPDGKIYLDNGSYTCLSPGNIPAGFNPGPGFHVVNQPNVAGLACSPQFNSIVVNDFTGNMGASFYAGADGGKSYLQQDIVVQSPPPDTLPGQAFTLMACFRDSMILSADASGGCYHWDDGSTERERTIRHSGTYYVQYFKDCHYMTDTFHANLIKMPQILSNQSCPDMHMGRLITISDSDNRGPLNYIWRTMDSAILRQFTGAGGDTLTGIDPGGYLLEVSTTSGCDTVISAIVRSLPKPNITAFPTDTVVRYGDSLPLHAEGAILYAWSPSSPLDTPTKAVPIARPLKPTLFSVIGMNEYGCEDTAFVKVYIDFTMPDFVPNAFSPNGDGLNDVFKINNITYQKVVAFRIYNRFGQLVFSTWDGQQGWDGTQNNKPCDVGTYYYFIQLDYPDGKRSTYKGDLTLIR